MHAYIIKTHDSESRGQEEAGRTQLTSEFLADIRVLSHMPVSNAASDWPRTFYTPGVFV